jgi:hypothetical protein
MFDITCSANHSVARCAQFLATVFPCSQDDSYPIGGWIEINAREFQEHLSRKFHQSSVVTDDELRAHLIGVLIQKINNNSYGAGQVYELYEERKQATLRSLLNRLILTTDEVLLIKNQCEYTEDMEPFKDLCDCGAEVNALQFAQSLSMFGKTTCTNCCAY